MFFYLFPAAQREKELCGNRSSQYVASQTLTEVDFYLLLFFCCGPSKNNDPQVH